MNLQTNSHKIHEQNSLIQESKRQKALKEAGGATFGATMLAQNLDIVMSEQATKIAQLSTQSISVINDTKALATSLLNQNINALKFPTNAYGYSIDSGGFMGEDFNKAAGLPQHIKIHKSSIDELVDFNERAYLFKSRNAKTFENFDIADTVRSYYRVFENVVGKSDISTYSAQQLSQLPKGYSFDIGTNITQGLNFLPSVDSYKVTHVYRDNDALNEAKELKQSLEAADVKGFGFNELKFGNENSTGEGGGLFFVPDMSVYKNDDGMSAAGVFVKFLQSISPRANDGGATKLSQDAQAHSAFSILEGDHVLEGAMARVKQFEAMLRAQDELLVQELLKPRKNQDESLAKQIFDKVGNKEEQEKLMQKINALASSAV